MLERSDLMVTVSNIYDFLNEIAPFDCAAKFDNVGILVGNNESKVRKVLISLDITSEVISEAIKGDFNLIVSHHPVIFKPLYSIRFDSIASLLIKNSINAICVHTNLDSASEGVNYHLAKSLGLHSISKFAFEDSHSYGMIGILNKKMNSLEFAKFVKEKLKCENLRYTDNSSEISKVAVCSGAGGVFVDEAISSGADAFVTGEIKHSQILKANMHGMTIIDTGHFKSENIIVKPLKQKLEKEFTKTEFKISESCTDKIKYL